MLLKHGPRYPVQVLIDRRTAQWLEATKAQTGLSVSEQVRRGVRLWLEKSRSSGPDAGALLKRR